MLNYSRSIALFCQVTLVVLCLIVAARAQAVSYSVQDVAPSTISDTSILYYPKKINDNRVITGFRSSSVDGFVSQVWPGPPAAGGPYSVAYDISSSGIVAGRGNFANFDNRAYLFNSVAQSLFWLPCPYPSQYGRFCEAYALNNNGIVVGTSDPRFLYPDSQDATSKALRWDSNGLTEIIPGTISLAYDVNASGNIAGMVNYEPFIWSPTTGLFRLGAFSNTGSVARLYSAIGINDSNHVVGAHNVDTNRNVRRAYFWDGVAARDLGSFGLDSTNSEPTVVVNDLNNSDQAVGKAVVGVDQNGLARYHAFIWDPQNGMRDLNSMIPANSGIVLTEATGINTNGDIAAAGYKIGNNPYIQRAYLLKRAVEVRPPVIFIPGTMGSNIRGNWYGNDRQFWVNINPISNSLFPSVKNLTLDETDTAFYTPGLYPSDVMRSALGFPVYNRMLEFLEGNGYTPYDYNGHLLSITGCDLSQASNNPSLFVFPYDWRQDNNQTADKLREYIQCVKQFYPPSTKIDILAHSQGGLIARKYILQSQIRNEAHGLGKVITIGSPFLGAPEATYKLYTGGDFNKLSIAASPSNIKFLAPHFPSMHQLLPSRKYHDFEGVIVAESGDVNGNGTPDEIYSFEQNISQLNSDFPNTTPGTVGAGFHDTAGQDDWRQDTSGIEYFHIVGEQSQLNTTHALSVEISLQCRLTGSGIGLGGRCFNDRLYIPEKGFGDGTVPISSALRTKTLSDGQIIDLLAPGTKLYPYRSVNKRCDDFAEHNGLHKNKWVQSIVAYLLNVGPMPPFGESVDCEALSSSEPPTSIAQTAGKEYSSNSISSTTGGVVTQLEKGQNLTHDIADFSASFYLSLAGVSDVVVHDEDGNSAFIDTTTSLLTNNISGLVGYEMIGDGSAMLTTSADQTYTVEFNSPNRAIGIDLVTGKGNRNLTEANRWNDLNIPDGAKIRLTISNTITTKLEYDADGDGQFETVVAPTVHLTGSAASDVMSPSININIAQAGTQATATITALDAQTGVNRIFYSTDGVNFQIYSSPFNLSYTSSPISIYAFADDNAANRSGVYTKTFTFAPVDVPAVVRHGLSLSGRIEGSVQQQLGENTTMNGSSSITGDLLVPGIPTLVRNGSSIFGGTITGTGNTQPTNYSVTLNGSANLGHLRNRTDASPMPTVTPPPAPAGTRNVTINNSSQNIGDFTTLRNLTLNNTAGLRVIPPGTYGSFTSNSGNGFILGIAGSTVPAVYNLQALTLNSGSQLQIVGPVLLTLATGVTLNASSGTSTNSNWLQMRIASGGLTLNSSSTLFGSVIAPSGTITINGNTRLTGNITADRLIINSNGILQIVNP